MYRRKKPKEGRTLMNIGLLLILAAFSLASYNFWLQNRAEEISLNLLKELYYIEEGIQYEKEAIADYILNPEMSMPSIEVDGKRYIGILKIPSLKLSLPIMKETTDRDLKIAPGRYKGSAYTDDLIISGHNYRTHFANIKSLSPGDEAVLYDADGNSFHYQVVEREVLKGTDVKKMEEGDWDLSLFTCTLGGQNRITVRLVKMRPFVSSTNENVTIKSKT